jgi:release factor glutamine methyltransferase
MLASLVWMIAGRPSMLTVLEIIRKTTDFLEAKGVESPRLNAERIIGNVLGLPRMQLYLQFERLLTEPELALIRPLVKRRSQREPLQYILGDTEFFHLRLKIDRRALIPRPETERLCELITQRLSTPPAAILDLGTGCGAIALGLAAFYSSAMVTALDASEDALALARENAEALGLSGRTRLLCSDWFTALEPGVRFDLVVANPPYLSVREAATTLAEVREHEPPMALASGTDGTEALLHIIAEAPRFLTIAGLLALETGGDQHAVLRERAAGAGFARIESLRDLRDLDRYLLAWRQ